MNNTFNIQRFGLLLKRQWLEFGKIFLITVGVALGVIITFYTFSLWDVFFAERPSFSQRDLGFREPLFIIFGFLFITVISSSYFAHLGQKPKAIIDLMIPASTFEKFLTGVFFTTILSVASFTLVFYLADLAFVSKVRSSFATVSNVTSYTDARGQVTETVDNAMYFFTKNFPEKFKSLFIMVPFFVTSVFLLGSLYFNRFHYIKTAISVIIFSGVWSFILYNTGRLLFEGKIMIEHDRQNFKPTDAGAELAIFAFFAVLTLIFWTIGYIRLKEKQV
ncbi:hypothetical protein [Pedobacter namyangjuensis]|uniref:hypothetical protein n=1 Tax=Pedobacter namyangjuensis TaxID=600626 RepID=UPI000DE5616A|nr:hypothetical protein [Pedobacter namyangjuensis]